MNDQNAQNMALDALLWLSGEEELVSSFIAMTGADVQDLRRQAQNPEFLGFVMDFVLSDDSLVISCAQSLGVAPENLAQIRARLPGGDVPDWT